MPGMFFKVKPGKPGPKASERAVWASLVALGLNIVAGFALFVFLGHWIDGRYGTGAFWTVCGAFVGMAYMIYEMWKAARDINAAVDQKTDDDKDKPTPP